MNVSSKLTSETSIEQDSPLAQLIEPDEVVMLPPSGTSISTLQAASNKEVRMTQMAPVYLKVLSSDYKLDKYRPDNIEPIQQERLVAQFSRWRLTALTNNTQNVQIIIPNGFTPTKEPIKPL